MGWAVIPLVVVYALSQLISSELSATAAMSKNQRWLMRVLPLGIVFFVFQFPVPSGVVIYWATTNLWTAGQQLVLKRRIEAEIEASEAADKAAGVKKCDDTDVVDEAPEDVAEDAAGDAAVATTAAVVAPETRRGTPKRRSKRPAGAPPPPPDADAAAPEASDVPDEAPEAPAAPGNGAGKRQPPSRKKNVSGGPTRPAGKKKPPKRRK